MQDPVIGITNGRPRPVAAQAAQGFIFAGSLSKKLLQCFCGGIIIGNDPARVAIGNIEQVVNRMAEGSVEVGQLLQVGGLNDGSGHRMILWLKTYCRTGLVALPFHGDLV